MALQMRGPGRPALVCSEEPVCLPSTSSRCNVVPARYGAASGRRRDMRCRGRDHDFMFWREELPIPKGYEEGVLKGVRTVATPMMSPQKVVDRLYNTVHKKASEHFGAFYSSELGGIVTNPAFMFVHMDDHMIHRGHAVFDTALITKGYIYQLPEHIARLKRSAEAAQIPLPMSDEQMMRIILDTAAASRKMHGIVKFWLSAGRGGFGLSSEECIESVFYAMATSESTVEPDRLKGWTACATPILPKDSRFAKIKSTNYLQNVMALDSAKLSGYDVGIFVDEGGYVLEGPNNNIAIITEDGTFVTPPFDRCLDGITVQRLMTLIPQERELSPTEILITKVEQRPLHQDEVAAAKEAFLVGSGIRIMPLTHWNGAPIADGKPGLIALALNATLEKDQEPWEGTDVHIAVPYGYATGMRSQLV